MITGIVILIFFSLLKSFILLEISLLILKLLKIRITKLQGLIICSLFFILTTITNLELYFPLYPYISTKFHDAFHLEKYRNISKGMSRAEVESLIGKGFDHFSMLPDTSKGEKSCICYSDDNDTVFLYDFAWIGMNVCYDINNQVTRTVETIIRN